MDVSQNVGAPACMRVGTPCNRECCQDLQASGKQGVAGPGRGGGIEHTLRCRHCEASKKTPALWFTNYGRDTQHRRTMVSTETYLSQRRPGDVSPLCNVPGWRLESTGPRSPRVCVGSACVPDAAPCSKFHAACKALSC